MLHPNSLTISIVVPLVASLIAAASDVYRYKVPNALTFPVLLAGLAYHGVTAGWPGLSMSLVGVLYGFGTLVVLYVLGGMGAGDVKLMAALGAWLGGPATLQVVLASSILAGVYAVGVAVVSGTLGETLIRLQGLTLRMATPDRVLAAGERVEAEVRRPGRRSRLIPFAAMVALGLIATLFGVGGPEGSQLLAARGPISQSAAR